MSGVSRGHMGHELYACFLIHASVLRKPSARSFRADDVVLHTLVPELACVDTTVVSA